MELDDLYGLPFDRFVPERAALAKALRADKRREEAAEVAALRKPSVTAWAVNQLVRTRGPAIEELFEAGDALRGAQADLLAGRGDGRMLRTAAEREREAVERLVADAGRLPISERAQLSGAVVERIADTLHAAALDEDAREQVRGGRLERELRHVGLGLGLGESPGAAPVPAVRRARPAEGDASADAARAARPAEEDARRVAPPAGGEAGAPAKPAPRAKGDAGGRAAGGAARTERGAEERAAERERIAAERAARQRLEREREQARKAARAAETAARHRAERADRAVRNAEERRERAAQALAAADDALATAREEAEAAAREHQRAQADHGRR